MEAQRTSLVTQLRNQLDEDDVTATLMTKIGVDAEVGIFCQIIFESMKLYYLLLTEEFNFMYY